MSSASTRTSQTVSSPPEDSSARKAMKMNGKASRTSSASASTREAVGNLPTPWTFMADISRQQLAVATEMTSILLRGRENMRKIQQEAAHDASVRHGDAAETLYGPCEPSDLLPIQAELLKDNFQSASQYWQQLTSVAMQTQRDMMTSMSRMFESENGAAGVKSALEAFQATVPALASSFFVTGSNRQSEQQHDS
ncbi:MAG: phasin family protein [Polaromonas sp.]